ncbi:MAG: hypothetical protein IT344_07385 [Candidatus Dadabacteria bacterium]|nr:hypothetical protein [Candidatus Dadabacteria bacterium]
MPRLDYLLKRFLLLSLAPVFTIMLLLSGSIAESAPIEIAEGSKSSGNEVMKSIEAGKDYKGMTKEEVAAGIGEPWRRDTTPVKARYDEKWVYSCQTKNGITYDCVYLYFMGGRVVNVEVL